MSDSRFELAARPGHSAATDIIAVAGIGLGIALQAFAGHPTSTDVVARSAAYYQAAESAAPAFPTQYTGLRVWTGGAVVDLCLVAPDDAPLGVGGVIKIETPSGIRVVYLVETADSYASPVRIRTALGTMAVRLKT